MRLNDVYWFHNESEISRYNSDNYRYGVKFRINDVYHINKGSELLRYCADNYWEDSISLLFGYAEKEECCDEEDCDCGAE